MTELESTYRYLNLIRNKAKRCYGFSYVAWIRNGCVGIEPQRGTLSFMATQAVRLKIGELLDNRPLDFAAEGRR